MSIEIIKRIDPALSIMWPYPRDGAQPGGAPRGR